MAQPGILDLEHRRETIVEIWFGTRMAQPGTLDLEHRHETSVETWFGDGLMGLAGMLDLEHRGKATVVCLFLASHSLHRTRNAAADPVAL